MRGLDEDTVTAEKRRRIFQPVVRWVRGMEAAQGVQGSEVELFIRLTQNNKCIILNRPKIKITMAQKSSL